MQFESQFPSNYYVDTQRRRVSEEAMSMLLVMLNILIFSSVNPKIMSECFFVRRQNNITHIQNYWSFELFP
jgi:hypothetical protein